MKSMRSRIPYPVIAVALTLAIGATGASSAGDFPVASCKGWNGTITAFDGPDTRHATMSGAITEADIRDFCERDPDHETKAYGGSLKTDQCVAKYATRTSSVVLWTRANCEYGSIVYRRDDYEMRARFPLGPLVDRSCASGMPPLIEQFKILCPKSFRSFMVDY